MYDVCSLVTFHICICSRLVSLFHIIVLRLSNADEYSTCDMWFVIKPVVICRILPLTARGRCLVVPALLEKDYLNVGILSCCPILLCVAGDQNRARL